MTIASVFTPRPALSIRQPWAELILQGRKRIEVRSWIDSYRGPIWIHSGRQVDLPAMQHFGMHDLFAGGYVGAADLVDIMPLNAERWERWRGRHFIGGPPPEGAFAWILSDPLRLREPLPGPGQLKLFAVNAETEAQLLQLLPA